MYFKVPPFNTKLDATFVDAPMWLLVPPFARVPTDRIPPLMVVTPVKVFVPVSNQVPAADLVKLVKPVLLANTADNLLSPVLLPVRVNVRALVPV